MTRLSGKIALVTGGSSGIGFGIAERFAAEGAYVYVVGRRQAELDQAALRIGANAEAVQADVTRTADLDRLFSTIAAREGRLDILVMSAAINEPATIFDTTEDHFDKSFNINVRGMVFTVQRAAAMMQPGSAIVLIGSIAGSIGTPGFGAYAATKAAVRSFTRTWTNDLAARGIRVNTLSPGPIETAMFQGVSDEMRAALTSQVPLRRVGQVEEVAAAALFLASSESSFVAGVELFVDGGMNQV